MLFDNLPESGTVHNCVPIDGPGNIVHIPSHKTSSSLSLIPYHKMRLIYFHGPPTQTELRAVPDSRKLSASYNIQVKSLYNNFSLYSILLIIEN